MTADAGGPDAGEEGRPVGAAADVPDRTETGGEGGALPGRAVAVYVLLAAAAVFVLVRNLGRVNDFGNFLPFGVAALAGLDPYTPEMVDLFGTGPLWSTWPPSFAPIAAALARLESLAGWPATAVVWQAAGLGAVALVLAVWTRWLYGRRLSLRQGPGRVPLASAAALAGLAIPARLVLSNFEHNQANLVVLGLAVAGLWLFRDGRRWSGGLAVGLATAFKATPLLLLPYLAWRGRWRDVGASLAGCAVAWLLLPGLLLGPSEAAGWYGGWLGFVGDLPLPVVHSNQSFQAAAARALAPAAAGEGHVFGAGPLGVPGARGATATAGALVALAAAVSSGRPGRAVSARREALEVGVVFALMALFSPVAWKHHFALLLPLAAALWARTPAASRWVAPAAGSPPLARGSRAASVLYAGLAVAALAINGTATGLVGGALADRFEHWGVVTWSAGTLVLLALWLLWRERPRREPPEARPGHRLRHPGAPGLPA